MSSQTFYRLFALWIALAVVLVLLLVALAILVSSGGGIAPCPPTSILESAAVRIDFHHPPTDAELEWLDECGFTERGPG